MGSGLHSNSRFLHSAFSTEVGVYAGAVTAAVEEFELVILRTCREPHARPSQEVDQFVCELEQADFRV